MATTHACPDQPPDIASVRFHPLLDYGRAALDAVGGVDLETIAARPVAVPSLGIYMPQVRMRRNRHTLPAMPSYGIRLDQVLRRNVHSAGAVRAFCGIPESSALVLLCFAEDRVLESFWEDEVRVAAIAAGGWDLVTAPSFSFWFGRPRPMHFHALRRSYDSFQALQLRGAHAVPRVEFIDTADVDVQARWFNANAHVPLVSIDWMTCRRDRDWLEGLDLLECFDAATGTRLHYLINGTTVEPRITFLARRLGMDRLTLTEATTAKPPRIGPRSTDHLAADLLPRPSTATRIEIRYAEVTAAAERGAMQRYEERRKDNQPSNISSRL